MSVTRVVVAAAVVTTSILWPSHPTRDRVVAEPKPFAEEDTSVPTVCEYLVDHNLNEAVHYLAWKRGIDIVPDMVDLAFDEIHHHCPEMAWRLPTPSAPPSRSHWTTPHNHEQQPEEPQEPFSDEPMPLGEEIA
ncbi:hypothetical protein [Mycolicibacterium sphagni]|uniref:hypothetical protein n=1 Tax=Mycolicibacterium sphagni TaxID=1786 RepID=UPI0021F29935|nr:hypothetical protein [Mycolicibacterium sphagni]MCV7179541.1 hypothetical protein [Mycolicibacterium sphagni]